MPKKRKQPPVPAPPPAEPRAGPADSPVLRLLQRHPHGVVLACFLCSGATGLIYEVVWSRRLTLVFGVTVLAYSTVLAAFLGGLAAGSVIFGRLADRRTDGLRIYAMLEAGVGLLCFSTPWLFALVERAYVHVHPSLAGHVWALRVVRFGLASAVMFVPTALMGGTLPVLSRAVVRRLGEVGTEVSALYGINTLGAVLGATAAGFLLLPTVGLKGSIYLAAVVNLAIALLAYSVYLTQAQQLGTSSRTTAAQATALIPRGSPAASLELPEAESAVSPAAYAGLLVAYGFSGAAALIYEVVWTRILSLAFGTSTYAFSGMLAAFLAGLALGSIVAAGRRWSLIDRLREPLVWFGVIEVAIAASVTFLTPALDRMPFVFLWLFQGIGPRFWVLQAAEVSFAFLVMLPPAALMGFAFPLVTRIATERIGVLGRRLSAVYASNTLGTVVGSFAAGFVLIPLLGARYALAVGVALNGLVGLAYLAASFTRRRALAGVGFGMAAVSLAGWLVLPDWNKAVLSSGAYLYASFFAGRDAKALMEDKEILHYRDALTAAISVTRVQPPGLAKPLISLQINGKTDASTGDLSTQILFAHLPTLLVSQPRSSLVIGLASGCTLGALELHPEFRQIDCVEIEPDMVRVTDFFREWNHDCMKDSRVRMYLDDARNFVLVTKAQYEVLTSEPSNPWISGVANLFTREHFALCREHLAPNGIFCQWIPIYNLAPEDLRCIVATFRDVFPNSSLWIFPSLPSDAYLIATPSPLKIDIVDLARRAARPKVRADLVASGVTDIWDLLSGYLLGPATMEALSRGARLNTDDFPLLEFSSPMRLYTGAARQTMAEVLRIGASSSPPLGRCGVSTGDGYRSVLAGVTVAPPLRAVSERMDVTHDVQSYMSGNAASRVRATVHVACALAQAPLDLYVAKVGNPLAAGGQSLEPSTAPSRTFAAGGHQVSLWDAGRAPSGAAWAARWLCPRRERVYLVRVPSGPQAPSPEVVLSRVSCEH